MTTPADALIPDGTTAAETEWAVVIASLPAGLRTIIGETVETHVAALAARFYNVMMGIPEASTYLDHHLVESRLNLGLQRWLTDLFVETRTTSLAAAVAHQHRVGDTHARTKIPIHLVGRGARHLKHSIWELLTRNPAIDRSDLRHAVIYVNDLIDIAVEIMNTAFVRNSARAARTDEAYRLLSLSQDLAV